VETYLLFFIASIVAGVINALVGGGGLITFSLLMLDTSPVTVDATSAIPYSPRIPRRSGFNAHRQRVAGNLSSQGNFGSIAPNSKIFHKLGTGGAGKTETCIRKGVSRYEKAKCNYSGIDSTVWHCCFSRSESG
jgi:hypothetical protein